MLEGDTVWYGFAVGFVCGVVWTVVVACLVSTSRRERAARTRATDRVSDLNASTGRQAWTCL